MKQNIIESINIPEGINCEFTNKVLICKKDSASLSRKINLPTVKITVEGNSIKLGAKSGSKKELKYIRSHVAHIKNLFLGLQKKYEYKLEACNVHFPMTIKIDKSNMIINNFLGEKVSRIAKILPEVDVQVKGQFITVTSHDKESAGQTAANIEKATKVRNRDRRIFQDGIYITDKPGREM